LNLHPGSRGYRRLASRLRDVQAHAPAHTARLTFPAVFPVRCLDYIFVSQHFDVRAVRVPRDALTVITSDHLPLVCDLDLVRAHERERLEPKSVDVDEAAPDLR
jgi:endonuclease/exonuclease/phosphatase family metal-dependent hydrolase